MNNNFSGNLKEIRKENKLSQEQLAEQIGVSRQAISKWESGGAYPEMDKILLLCDKFDLNIDDLLHRDVKEIKSEEYTKNKILKLFEDFLKFITDSINLFISMNFKSKVKCLIEQVLIVLILMILSEIIIDIGKSVIPSMFSFLPTKAYQFLQGLTYSIFSIFCLILSTIAWIHIFKTRYLNYYNKLKDENNTNEKNEVNLENLTKQDINNKNEISFNKENKIIIRDLKHNEYKFFDGLFKLLIFFIKIIFSNLLIVFSSILIIFLIIFVLTFLIYKTGFLFVGLLSIILSSIVICIIFILVILNFIFNRKNNKKKIIYSFVSAVILFGFGCGLTFIGTLDFQYEENPKDLLETKELVLDMNENIFFDVNEKIDYIESENNNIILKYTINKYCDLNIYNIDNNAYYQVDYIDVFGIINEFINNLNNKKVVSVRSNIQDIKIYTSKENIEKMKANAYNYYQKREMFIQKEDLYNDNIEE